MIDVGQQRACGRHATFGRYMVTDLPTCYTPLPRGAQIVQLIFQPVQPHDLLTAVQMGQRVLGQGEKVGGVSPACCFRLPGHPQLFAPELAGLYARAANGSCTRYFERIMSSSVTVRRIVRHGPTAVLELRQTLNRANWAVVLTRRGTGWQAVDLLGAALLR